MKTAGKIRHKLHITMERLLSGETMSYRQVTGIILPILVDQMFIVCLNMLNTGMISSSGVAAVSAVNMVDSLNLFLVNVFIAVATGGTVVVAQYKGSGNDSMVSKASAQAIAAVGILAIAIAGIIILFRGPTLNVLFGKAEQDVSENARVFLVGSCLSYPCFAIYQAVIGVLRGVGDTKASLVLSVIQNLSFVLLNVLFITVLDMGVLGLCISLNVARFIGMAVAVIYIFKINHHLTFKLRDIFHFDFSMQKKILFIGIPFAAEQLFFNGGKILTQTFIVQLGTLPLTVNAITGSIVSVFQITGSALSLAVVTVVGQCIGRQHIEDAKKFIKSFVGLAFIALILSFAIIMPFFPWIVQLYSPPPEIIPDIRLICWIFGFTQPILWPISFIVPSALRAAGDAKFTSISSMLSMWLFRVILGYILGIVLPFGIVGVWSAMICEWGIRSIIYWRRFKGTKWYQHKLI